jgi:hypothetical protein
MTVCRRDLLDPITAEMHSVDEDLSCFRLTAFREVLIDRIASDTEDREACGRRMSHVEVCLRTSLDPALGTEIRTDNRTSVGVAYQILKNLAVPTR